MTLSVLFTTGNGYHCGCCRREDRSELFAHDEADALAQCIVEAQTADWDFSIRRILFLECATDPTLLKRLEAGVLRAKCMQELQDELEQSQHRTAEIDQWFATLEAQKSTKTADRNRFLDEQKTILTRIAAASSRGP